NFSAFDYMGCNEGNYYYFSQYTTSWTNAFNDCQQFGGHILTINNQEEQNFIESIATFSPALHLGIEKNNTSQWITGEPVVFSNWETSNFNQCCYGEFLWNDGTWGFDPNTSQHRICMEIETNGLCPLTSDILWSTGSTEPNITVSPSQTTTYSVSVDNGTTVCTDSVTVTVNATDATFANATSCNPLDTGVVSVTNPNQFGCDSVHTITTTLLPSDATFANATSCNPLDTGIVSVTNPNQFGCDSVHTVTTTLLPSDATFANATSCNPLDTGVVSVTNPNQFGCDSVHTITTTLLPSDATFANATSCNPLDTGVVSVTNPNQFACDSVHTVTTTLLPSDATFANATSCNPLDTGVVSVTNPNQFGCDSVHTITTTLLPSDATFANATS
ncbi:MAG: C-type lectin domain-containing protein, partial [Chitinophagales bacterium]